MKAKIIATLGLVVLLGLAENSNAQTGNPITDSFSCIQAYQTWIVPDNIHSIEVVAAGSSSEAWTGGGYGGVVKTTLVVTPGETLYLNVGGLPYNGGGNDVAPWVEGNDYSGRAGGGLTSLGRTGNRLTDTLIVAGGAGGPLNYCLYDGDDDFLGWQAGGNGGDTTTSAFLYTSGSFMQGGDGLQGGGGGGGYHGGGGGERSPGDGGTSYVTPVGTSNTVYQAGGNGNGSYGYLKITYYTPAEIPAVAGTISGQGYVCSGTNSTMLSLGGYTGTIQWQSSTDNASFANISGATGTSYAATNLSATTWYRTVVTSGSTSATSPGKAVTVSALPSINVTSSNPHLYFGAPGDQTSTITASATGGAAPYTITFSSSRALISNYINDAGDEIWKAPGSTTTTANPPSVFTGIADEGLASINVALLADADITATVTDANGCTQIAGTIHVIAEDARCFAGKSGKVKVLMCHVTGSNKNPRVQICVDENAVQSHLDQGDFLGSCTVTTRDMNLNTADAVETVPGMAQKGEVLGKLSVTVMPNPTSYYFTLALKSLSKEKIKVTVTDITGRVIEQRTDIPANSSIQLAGHYHPGVYIAEFLQGIDKVTTRLIKEGE